MPISRYEVRNEYSLADPDLYRAADKDDPEALLEGVAMAGLVGVLRQLGDLAEFAADIFHNLHEEVMATAARGHGLMSRVQQLETEIPSIERAFLAQTDHSSFFTHPGVDWHPNLRIDQNLITQGDLPRLVMDSYEECRPPPRLFILDKFDVAGAGACLKRYTDPSFFKVENSGMAKADVPREKKIRKAKKKGPRWKNRETPEVLPTSHTKLHQLFLEEARIENNVSNPARRAKLKRKLNGFPFNSKTGKSYMEKLLQHPSPDNKKITFDHNESGLEVIEVRPVSRRDRENLGRKRSPPSSPDRESDEVVNLYHSISTYGDISSAPDEKIIAVDDESNRESYQSDDIVSEVDNYVDAISNTESDTDADSKSRVNSDFTSSHVKNESLISDENDENLQIGSLDSQSTEDSTISDDGNSSSRKGMSTSIASDSPSTSAENPRSERISSRGFSSDHIPEVDEIVDASFYHKTDDDDETDFTLDDEEKESNLVMEPPCSPSVSDSDLQSGDESRRYETNGENIPCVSTVPYNHYRTTDSLDKVTSDSVHEDECEQEDRNSVDNIAFKINNFNSQNPNSTPSEPPPSKNLIPGKLNDDFQKLPNDISSYYPDIVHNGDSIKSTVSEEKNLTNRLYNEDSGVLTDSPKQFPSFMDTFLKTELEETSSANAQTINFEDDQICSENFVFLRQVNSSDWPQAGIDAQEGDVVPDKETKVNETFALETPNDSEVQESPFSTPGELLEPTGTSEYVEMDGRKFNDLEFIEIPGSADLKSPNEDDILFGKPDSGEDTSNIADISSALPALSDKLIIVGDPSPVGPNNLQLEGSGVEELENGMISLSGNREESGIVVHREITQPHVEQSLVDRECESEKSIIQEEFWSLPSQLDRELLHSHEINSEVSAVLPIIHQQTPGHDYLEKDNNSELGFSKDPLDSFPPPSNPFSETNPINLGDLAPLPPLPPAQWMMGKLELGSSSTEGETMKHDKLLFPQFISHPVVPTEEKKKPLIQIADEPPSKEEKVIESSCAEVNAAPETVDLLPKSEKQQPTIVPAISESEFADEPTSKEEKVIESSCAEVNAAPETVDLLPKSEKQKLIIVPAISESEFADEPTSKEEKVIESSCAEVNAAPETVDLLPKSEKQQPTIVPAISESEFADEPASKEEKVIESSCAEVSAEPQKVDLLPKWEKKQLIIVPAYSESEFASLAEKDGVGNGSRTVKVPRPRHPLIDEVTALDKSKLRKVTERIMPQVQKVEERNTLLEQIRTKSFNLKPALASRPSVRGPSTNLQVAAIVEKANAIRQAFADSDEDDDDSWSDS